MPTHITPNNYLQLEVEVDLNSPSISGEIGHIQEQFATKMTGFEGLYYWGWITLTQVTLCRCFLTDVHRILEQDTSDILIQF